MKVTLEFNLPEEVEEHRSALHGVDYLCALQDLDNWLRGLYKYEQRHDILISDVRSKLTELCNDSNIDIWG